MPLATHLNDMSFNAKRVRGDMKHSIILMFVMITGIAAIPVMAESAEHAYKAGENAEKQNDYDAAYEAFKRAHSTVYPTRSTQ